MASFAPGKRVWAEKILVVLIKTRGMGVPSQGLERSPSKQAVAWCNSS